jgi:hypothetical protein
MKCKSIIHFYLQRLGKMITSSTGSTRCSTRSSQRKSHAIMELMSDFSETSCIHHQGLMWFTSYSQAVFIYKAAVSCPKIYFSQTWSMQEQLTTYLMYKYGVQIRHSPLAPATPIMGKDTVSEISDTNSTVAQLIAWENSIWYCGRESFKW